MKTRRILSLALFAPLIIGAAHAQDNPLYWVAQAADTPLSYEVFSPDGSVENALTSEPADWSVYDIIFDARYSGANADGYGVNNFTGIPGDWSVKSVTVADNWDDSQSAMNKDTLWWETNASTAEDQKNYTWKVAGDFSIYSALGGWNKNVTLDIGGGLNIDVSQKTVDGSKDRGRRDVYLVNLGGLNVAKDVTVANGGIVSLQSNKDVKIGGNLSVANAAQFNYAEAGLGAESPDAGFVVQGNVTLSNINEARSWYSNRIYVGGDFTATDVKILQMDWTGSTRDSVYTNPENNGIWINGDMNLTRVGDGWGDTFYGWNSAFFRVGKSLNLVEMTGSMKFGGIGSLGGKSGGGIEIGENLFVDNRESPEKYEVHFEDSNYMTVGKNVTLYNTFLGAWNLQRAEIGGDLFVADGASAIFERVSDRVIIKGDVTLEGNALYQNRDSGYTYIGGDLNIGTGDIVFGNHKGKDGAAASLDNVGLEIGGRINMGGGKFGLFYASGNVGAPGADETLYVSAGGINGSGTVYTGLEHKTEYIFGTTLILNNTANSVFEGGITYYNPASDPTVEYEKMSFNIIKNGAGSQTIILNDKTSPSAFDYSRWRGKVTVNEGLMSLYTGSYGTVKLDFELNGGSLGVAYSKAGAYDPENDYMGVLRAGKIDINGDVQIIFDVADNRDLGMGYESDIIEADEVGGSGLVTLVIELDATTFSIGDEISGDEVQFRLFQIANSNNYDWAQALIKVMYKGEDISDSFEKLVHFNGDSSGSVYVSLDGIVVPEPAGIAAVLGALSLAFAARRRRR